MKTSILRIILITVMVSLAACSPAATEPPAAVTPFPASSTPLPPTNTPIPLETPIPTATLVVKLENITGMWTREDPERGTLFLVFREDGTFDASHGSPESIVHTGTFTISDGVIIFATGWDCSPAEGDVPGQYSLRLIADGRNLFFTLIDDPCPDRPAALKSFRWNRVLSTP